YIFYSEHGSDPSLLVSPLLVAGVVIGLVLVLSCVTIIVGSLRKDGRLRHTQLRRDASYGKRADGFSYGGSFGELRSTCMEEFPPAFEFASYLETLSRVNVLYPDSPPCYDECVGPGATQIYIPTDDPPPYSLTDPCHRGAAARDPGTAEEAAPGAPAEAAGLQHWRQPRPLSPLSLEAEGDPVAEGRGAARPERPGRAGGGGGGGRAEVPGVEQSPPEPTGRSASPPTAADAAQGKRFLSSFLFQGA
uniref:BEAN1 protein n=1 Tax=Nothoprocta perdicaria TaxID=30464 RepID=A0A8C6YVQ8_NOTPE